MAYVPTYQIQYLNTQSEEINIVFSKKDGEQVDIQQYAAVGVRISYNGEESKYTPIIGMSAEIEFNMLDSDMDYWEEFQNAEKDTWLVTITNTEQAVFHGFVVPDEGRTPFQDRPYNAVITAVDGLGLLKDMPLLQANQTEFRGEYTLINYLSAALLTTGLALPIRIFDTVYHSSMVTRDTDINADLWNQTKLDYRTFQKDAVTFVDCYTVLEKLLGEGYRLFYRKGEWTIIRLGALQYVPFVLYCTIYDYNGLNPQGFEITDNYATVGKNELIFPVNRDQIKSTKKAVKSTQTTYKYNTWPEIPKNNKFERGSLIRAGIAYDTYDIDSDEDTAEPIGTYKDYTIDDWQYGQVTVNLPNLNPPANGGTAYRRSVFNSFDIELYREIILEKSGGNTLLAEPIPVVRGDRFTIEFSRRQSVPYSDALYKAIAFIFIQAPNGQRYSLDYKFYSGGTLNKNWVTGYNALVGRSTAPTDDGTKYEAYTIDSPEIPISGTMYIMLANNDSPQVFFKGFNFTYRPFIAGGYIEAEGEYWLRNQDRNYPDKTEAEIYISDNEHKVFQGALLDLNGVPYSPDWRRLGLDEHRHFKEISNLERFNHEHRRFWTIEGTFKGLRYAPSNDQENYQPLSLHKQYRFVDIAGDDKRFILCPPLEMDLITGNIRANFWEVSANQTTSMQTPSVSQMITKLVNKVKSTNFGSTVVATTEHPLIIFSGVQRAFITACPQSGPSITGAGVTNTYSIDNSGTHQQVWQFPEVINVGEVYSLTLNGTTASVTVELVEVSSGNDGQQEGIAQFKYQFK